MNRINQLFAQQKSDILSIYFTAGYPTLESTVSIIQSLEKAGANMIEIGMPFSDPLADGPTIQASSQQALENGMQVATLLQQLQHIRQTVRIPLVLMGYLNPIYQYGIQKFCQACQNIGIDGLIIPDLPLAVYEQKYKTIFEACNLHNIFLITPQTSPQRIQQIDAISQGFIYMVADAATTGAKKGIASQQQAYFKRINALQLANPRLIGFGISNHQTYSEACKYANGVIIGSAFIKAIATATNASSLNKAIHHFVQKIRMPHS